jgi:hypothetical protein
MGEGGESKYYYKQEGDKVTIKAEMPKAVSKCYDWSNKNLRVVEWVKCSEKMPEEGRKCIGVFEIKDDWFSPSIIEFRIDTSGGDVNKYYDGNGSLLGAAYKRLLWWFYIPELPTEESKPDKNGYYMQDGQLMHDMVHRKGEE